MSSTDMLAMETGRKAGDGEAQIKSRPLKPAGPEGQAGARKRRFRQREARAGSKE
jgi:hypothetical protein